MRLLITGFSNSGKTTIFNALAGLNFEVTVYPTLASSNPEPHIGIVNVPDSRVERLSAVYKPKKKTFATIEYIDYIGFTKGDTAQNFRVFNFIKEADAIVHVIRAFDDPAVLHPMESIDPVRDARDFESELILGDLEFIEKRLERIEHSLKRGEKKTVKPGDKELLLKCMSALESEIPLRHLEFTEEEKKLMQAYQLLSISPEIIVLNMAEGDLKTDKESRLKAELENYFKAKSPTPNSQAPDYPVLFLCGKIEMEVSQLLVEERAEFLKELSIKEPATDKLCRISYERLGLITFFTVGEDEVKAWTIKKGTNAQKSAGKIHSDIERGFIRAEVIGFDDFVQSGENMVTAKGKGLLRLEGKEYIVRDGDIINFKFNV
ncbi:MAG: redox-regulated ATPase YchF [Nitrospirae bacterium]|nr:redox-regulated ATPase YchF [Nitrospirota bacterium]